MISSLYKVVQYFSKKITLKFPLPSFIIDFAAARWDTFTFDFLDERFISGEIFIPGVETIHFKSDKDPLIPFLKNEYNVESGSVIMFDDGPRPPKILGLKELTTTADFLLRQLVRKHKNYSQELQ